MSDLAFILTGFGIVIAVLSFLWLVCTVVGVLHKERDQPQSRAAEVPGPALSPIPSAHLAAISAAIAVMLPGQHRIVRVYAPGHKSSGWVDEGRFDLSNSHRIRWDWAKTGPLDKAKTNQTPNSHGKRQ